jgi:hypothetical protein
MQTLLLLRLIACLIIIEGMILSLSGGLVGVLAGNLTVGRSLASR